MCTQLRTSLSSFFLTSHTTSAPAVQETIIQPSMPERISAPRVEKSSSSSPQFSTPSPPPPPPPPPAKLSPPSSPPPPPPIQPSPPSSPPPPPPFQPSPPPIQPVPPVTHRHGFSRRESEERWQEEQRERERQAQEIAMMYSRYSPVFSPRQSSLSPVLEVADESGRVVEFRIPPPPPPSQEDPPTIATPSPPPQVTTSPKPDLYRAQVRYAICTVCGRGQTC